MDTEDLKTNISAVLTSGGGKLTDRQFLSDYRNLFGEHVPWVKFGHKTLISLIESLGGFYVTRNGFETIINAGYDPKTAHIAALISKQKKSSKKGTKKSSIYSRPKLPPRLNQLNRPFHAASSSHLSSNKPRFFQSKYGNPPIIAQRQSVSSSYPPIIPQRKPLTSSSNPPIIPQRKPLTSSSNPPIIPQRKPLTSSSNPPIIPQRTPLNPSYSNPPIIPQRQPLQSSPSSPLFPQRQPLPKTSMQDRLNKEGPQKSSDAAKSRIISTTNGESSMPVSNPHVNDDESSSVEEQLKDVTFVDIQWLHGKIQDTGRDKKKQVIVSSNQTNANPSGDDWPLPYSAPLMEPVEVLPTPLQPTSLHSIPPVNLQPTGTPPPLKEKQKSRTRLNQKGNDHVLKLSSLAFDLSLPLPDYKYIERKPSKGKVVYLAKVKIGQDLLFSSYPDEKGTRDEAQELVAQLAYNELLKRLCADSSSDPVDDSEVISRVYSIIQEKSNGMFDEAISQEYEKAHAVKLPQNWLSLIKTSTSMSIEKFNGGKAIVYPRRQDSAGHCNGISHLQIPPSSPSPILSSPPDSLSAPNSPGTPNSLSTPNSPSPPNSPSTPTKNLSTSVGCIPGNVNSEEKELKDFNCNTLEPSRKLPDLVLPTAATWDVFVASISSNEVWVRLIGENYDAKYNEVMNDLEMKMLSGNTKVTHPVINEYYSVNFDNCWLRVQLKEISSKGEGSDEEPCCLVFLVDNGELDTIPLSELRVLDEDYLALPAQAIRCRLAYLNITFEEAQTYLLNQVIGSTFVAEVLQPPSEESFASIILYNTELEGEALNINNCILEEIIKNLESPQLSLKHINFVRFTHLDKEMPPFVQIKGRDLSLLETILDDVSNQDLVQRHGVNAYPRLTHKDSMDKHMFLVRSMQAPNTWRRGTIVNLEDARHPVVRFIDFGYTETVMLSDMFDLEKVLPPLCKFPIQAVQVNLFKLERTHLVEGVVKRFRELVPPHLFVLVKVIESGQMPSVEIFKRVGPENAICCVNTDVLFNLDELSKIPDDVEEDPRKVVSKPVSLRGSRGSTSPLVPYPLPTVGSDFFDIFVSMSSNPFNFVVQPVKELNSFHTMMNEMQELYEAQHHILPTPDLQDLQESATFAAKHPDDLQWYRVSVVHAASTNVLKDYVSIKYVDFGDVGLVAMDRLRYLDPKFKHIPALAIRAKLHGVVPKNHDWDVKECVKFNELVDGKYFVSKVLEINSESQSDTQWKLSVQLINTSKKDDVDIAALLVEGGFADLVR